MNPIKRVVEHFVYSNLFIAGCALLMTFQSFRLLHSKPDIHLLAFIFFSTICSYSFHWHLTPVSAQPSPRIVWMKRLRNTHVLLFMVGLLGAGYFFFYLLPYWPWLLFSAVVTFLYSAPKIPNVWFRALRKVALGKTIFLALVWMHVTTVLPLVVSSHQWTTGYILFIIARFFLIYAICILFDYRDREDDKASGIRSLITYLGESGINVLFIASLAVFTIACLLMLDHGFDTLTVVILLIPGYITAALYNYARTHFTDLFYYLALDGLMALSALLMLLAGI